MALSVPMQAHAPIASSPDSPWIGEDLPQSVLRVAEHCVLPSEVLSTYASILNDKKLRIFINEEGELTKKFLPMSVTTKRRRLDCEAEARRRGEPSPGQCWETIFDNSADNRYHAYADMCDAAKTFIDRFVAQRKPGLVAMKQAKSTVVWSFVGLSYFVRTSVHRRHLTALTIFAAAPRNH